MMRLGTILDKLTDKSMTLLKIEGQLEIGPLLMRENLHMQMTAMRIEARQLVKTIRLEVKELKEGA